MPRQIPESVVDFCTKEGADPRAGEGQRLNAFRRFTLECFHLHQQCVRG